MFQLGVLLNSMKRVLEKLRSSIENRFKAWNSYIPDKEKRVLGELRSKLRSNMQALVEKFAENTRIQSHTKMKHIIHDLRETTEESDARKRMQSLKDLLDKTLDHLHCVFSLDVFVLICRGLWDRLGQDVLRVLEDRNDNVLDEIFEAQMQSLLGNSIKEEILEAPRLIRELRSMLWKDSADYK